MVDNTDFETGDLTGWTDDSNGSGTYTATAGVTTGAKRTGTYGFRSYTSATDNPNYGTAVIKKTISSDFATISFWYKVNAMNRANTGAIIKAYLTTHNGYPVTDILWLTNPSEGDWTFVTINKVDIELEEGDYWDATTVLRIGCTSNAQGSGIEYNMEVFFDDLFKPAPNLLTNGDFEAGDLIGWTDTTSGNGTYTATATVTEDSKYAGSYGCRLYATIGAGSSGAFPGIKQSNISTDFTSLSFWYKINAIDTGATYYQIDVKLRMANGDLYPFNVWAAATQDWTLFTVDKGDIDLEDWYTWDNTTDITIELGVWNGGAGDLLEVFFDDIIITGSSYTSTGLQGKNDILIQTDLQGKLSLRTTADLQGITTIVLATQLQGKTSIEEAYSLSTLVKSGKVTANMTDRMMRGEFAFDGATVGGVFSGNYWKHVEFTIPDYTGTQQCVFVGFFPSSSAHYRDSEENEVLKAYDYAWYLTQNFLKDSDMVLLTPDKQATVSKYQLQFDFQEHAFQPGDIVTGGTTGDYGRIFEVIYGIFDVVIIWNPQYGPGRSAGDYFQDDEELLVGGDVYAYADGHAVDVTGAASVIYPDDWIKSALGGDDWNVLYGLEPYRIAATAPVWGTTVPAVDFPFKDQQTIRDAIEEPTKYLEYIFFAKWRTVGASQQPCVYWIPGSLIDDPTDGLDLPAAVTITSPDGYLVSVDIDQKGEESFNRVTVRCRGPSGTWYKKTVQSSTVDDKTERVREFRETAVNFFTQAECTTRAQDLYDYHYMQTITWNAVFLLRSDFRLLQKLVFSGFGAKLPDDTYRIIGIEYDYGDEGTTNTVTCTIIRNSAFLTWLSLNRSFTQSIKEIQSIVKEEVERVGLAEIGTVSTVDGLGGATHTTEDGLLKPGIDANP